MKVGSSQAEEKNEKQQKQLKDENGNESTQNEEEALEIDGGFDDLFN